MTRLETILADTFRLARWVDADGRFGGPVCGDCYDAEHVQEDRSKRQRRAFGGAKVYLCRACISRFTDRTDTPLARSRFGYRRWAMALLCPAEYAQTRYPQGFVRLAPGELRRLRAQLARAPELAGRWRAKLEDAGVTFAQVRDEEVRVQRARATVEARPA